MATLRNKRKLAAVARETSESTRSSISQNTIDPELAQDYVSHVSEEIEEGVTKKLSKEFVRTESRIFGALSKLDKFLLNPQVRTRSVAVPVTSGNSNSENREPTGDCSIDDPYTEVRFSSNHSVNLNNPGVEDYPHKVTGATEEIRQYPCMVTGGPEDFRNLLHMMTGTQGEIPYCSPGTSSGKQKKARSTNQP